MGSKNLNLEQIGRAPRPFCARRSVTGSLISFFGSSIVSLHGVFRNFVSIANGDDLIVRAHGQVLAFGDLLMGVMGVDSSGSESKAGKDRSQPLRNQSGARILFGV